MRDKKYIDVLWIQSGIPTRQILNFPHFVLIEILVNKMCVKIEE